MIGKKTASKTDGEIMQIYTKARKDGKYRFWVSVGTPDTDETGKKTGKYANASMPCYLSAKAFETFEAKAQETSNPEIYGAKMNVKSYWLKAVHGQDADYIALFINELEALE